MISEQVYRGLDIGTDKVPMEYRKRVPHRISPVHVPAPVHCAILCMYALSLSLLSLCA